MSYTNRVTTDGRPVPEVDAGQAVQSGDLLVAAKEFLRAYENPKDCDDISDTIAELLIECRIYFAANVEVSHGDVAELSEGPCQRCVGREVGGPVAVPDVLRKEHLKRSPDSEPYACEACDLRTHTAEKEQHEN